MQSAGVSCTFLRRCFARPRFPARPGPPGRPVSAQPAPPQHSPLDAYGHELRRAGGREVDRHDSLAQGAVAVALYESPHYDLAVPGLAMTRLSVNLVASPVSGGLDGAARRSYGGGRHTVFLTPSQATAHWCKPQPSRHVNLYFLADRFEDPLLPPRTWEAPLLDRHLPRVGRLADALARELAQPGPMTGLALDSLARLLLVEVARRDGARPAARALSAAMLARIDEFVRAHLAEPLRVRDLAAVAGLSPTHFAHAFTRATGGPPHRRVMALRLQHAVQLITTTACPLAEVAAACGFATQQHMTRVLRAQRGVTPARLRALGSL